MGYDVIKTVTILFAIIGFAYQFPQIEIRRDISFGIFIYHMTVVNAMITFGLIGENKYLIIAATISCALGYVSTITIGRYSAMKKIG